MRARLVVNVILKDSGLGRAREWAWRQLYLLMSRLTLVDMAGHVLQGNDWVSLIGIRQLMVVRSKQTPACQPAPMHACRRLLRIVEWSHLTRQISGEPSPYASLRYTILQQLLSCFLWLWTSLFSFMQQCCAGSFICDLSALRFEICRHCPC